MGRTDRCDLPHNGAAFAVAAVVCFGVTLSYIPQIIRIYSSRSSVGLSPWFLFLGATSSASAMFNVIVLQWPIVRCYSQLPFLSWMEHVMGILQVTLQWLMFSIVYVVGSHSFALFLRYYVVETTRLHRSKRKHRHHVPSESDPLHPAEEEEGHESSASESDLEEIHSHITQSYGAVSNDVSIRPHETHAERDQSSYLNIPRAMRRILENYHLPGEEEITGKLGTQEEWRRATWLAWITVAHWLFCAAGSMLLLSIGAHRGYIKHWVRFLGLTGTLLAVLQYLPQIVHTARARLVRSLSIPTMCVQVPGMVLFVYALASREGPDWTSLLAYIAAGVLQAVLLVLCVCWKVRQSRLHVDDYGRPL